MIQIKDTKILTNCIKNKLEYNLNSVKNRERRNFLRIKLFVRIILFEIILIAPLINAGIFSQGKDIVFSLNQTDYYFKVGENAIIPLEIKNTYDKTIDGILTYSYTQEINQGGVHFSSSNTNSISFSIENGNTVKNLNFGTSKNPLVFIVSLKFVYTEKEKREVTLDNIKIHFVSDNNQIQNTQNKKSSSSKEYSQENNQQSSQNSQNFYSQMQQQFNQMFNQNNPSQTPQQRMENNQLNQDSQALKKQIEKQKKEYQAMEKEFQKNLFNDKKIQTKNQELTNNGYDLKSMSLNPSSNNSGTFDLKYEKDGESAEIKGEMENGKIKNFQTLTPEDKKIIKNKLFNDARFKKFTKELQKEKFNETGTEFTLEENKTKIKINYKNPQNKTAEISAEVINGTIQNVEIKKDEESSFNNFISLLILIGFLAGVLLVGYYLYRKYYKKPKKTENTEKKIIHEKYFNYRKESWKLLEEAKILFRNGNYKDAYEKASQSLRLYLGYEHNLKKEVTNDEIIRFLKNKNINISKIKECFDLCSLVEFAKYKANKKDFEKIIRIIEGIFNNLKKD